LSSNRQLEKAFPGRRRNFSVFSEKKNREKGLRPRGGFSMVRQNHLGSGPFSPPKKPRLLGIGRPHRPTTAQILRRGSSFCSRRSFETNKGAPHLEKLRANAPRRGVFWEKAFFPLQGRPKKGGGPPSGRVPRRSPKAGGAFLFSGANPGEAPSNRGGPKNTRPPPPRLSRKRSPGPGAGLYFFFGKGGTKKGPPAPAFLAPRGGPQGGRGGPFAPPPRPTGFSNLDCWKKRRGKTLGGGKKKNLPPGGENFSPGGGPRGAGPPSPPVKTAPNLAGRGGGKGGKKSWRGGRKPVHPIFHPVRGRERGARGNPGWPGGRQRDPGGRPGGGAVPRPRVGEKRVPQKGAFRGVQPLCIPPGPGGR